MIKLWVFALDGGEDRWPDCFSRYFLPCRKFLFGDVADKCFHKIGRWMMMMYQVKYKRLLYCDRLCQISWLINIATTHHCNMIRKELQWDNRDHRHQRIQSAGYFNNKLRHFWNMGVTLGHNRNDATFASFYFLNIRNNLFVRSILRGDEYHRHFFIDQCDRAVFHFCSRVAFGMDI